MEPFTLVGRHVRLEPLGPEHVDALVAAATADRSTFGFTPVPGDRSGMAAYVDRAVAARDADDQHAFATWSVADDRIVGSTRFYDLTPWEWSARAPGAEDRQRVGRPDRASIGYTWLAPAAQRRAVNTEAKLLMLTHAFEVWEVYAVHLKTDARNARSRAAIERIGCTLDGIVRADMPASDGTVRDSAVFSMTAEEWPDRKSRLTARLAGSAG